MKAFGLLIGAFIVVSANSSLAQSTTRLLLTSSQNPTAAGRRVTFSAAVDGFSGGAPTGEVTFTEDGSPIGSASLVAQGAGQGTVTAGQFHTCGLAGSGSVMCWGYNDRGQLGDGTTRNRPTAGAVLGLDGGAAIALAAGAHHTCAVTTNRDVECWGGNNLGQIGDGTTDDRLTPTLVPGLTRVIALSASGDHTCALADDGTIRCWGNNAHGELGDGTTTTRSSPVLVRGIDASVAIAAGGQHTCALGGTGTVSCWGDNQYGELGDGTTVDRSTPAAVANLSGIVAVFAGQYHSCAISGSGAIDCWGVNSDGELGDNTRTNSATPVAAVYASDAVAGAAGSAHTCVLRSAGGVVCWGSQQFLQTGNGSIQSGAVAVTAGLVHSCALLDNGVFKCWGNNGVGELGNGRMGVKAQRGPQTVVNYSNVVRARAQIDTAGLTTGTYNIRATYPGDRKHSRAADSLKQQVN